MPRDGAAQRVHAGGDDFQSVDIQAGIGFIEDGEPGFEDGHLENFVALLFASGKSGVDGAIEQALIHLHQGDFPFDQREKIHGVEVGQALMLADGVERRLQKIQIADARNFHGILKRHKDAFAGAVFGRHFKQIFAVVNHLTGCYLVKIPSGQDLRERAFARTVGAHDGVHFAGIYGEVDAFQNFAPGYSGVQIFNFE